MTVLLYSNSNYIKTTFIYCLIPNGISIRHTEDSNKIIEMIVRHRTEIVILDATNDDYENIYKIMNNIMNAKSKIDFKFGIILLIGTVDQQKLNTSIKYGAIGFLKPNTTEESIIHYIENAYQKLTGNKLQKKYDRVSIDSEKLDEKVTIKFRSPTNSLIIIAKVKDMSFGGIAIELIGEYDSETIKAGHHIKNIQFRVDKRNVVVDAFILARKGNQCAMKFTNMTVQDRDAISGFIYRKLIESESLNQNSLIQDKQEKNIEVKDESKKENNRTTEENKNTVLTKEEKRMMITDEKIDVRFKSPNTGQLIWAKIIDINEDNVILLLNGEYSLESINVNDRIKDIDFTLDKRIIKVDGIVVEKSANLIDIKFVDMTHFDREIITEHIKNLKK